MFIMYFMFIAQSQSWSFYVSIIIVQVGPRQIGLNVTWTQMTWTPQIYRVTALSTARRLWMSCDGCVLLKESAIYTRVEYVKMQIENEHGVCCWPPSVYLGIFHVDPTLADRRKCLTAKWMQPV